jgi:hypothetical protein
MNEKEKESNINEEQQVNTLSMFGNCKPAQAIANAVEIANEVAKIIQERHLFTIISQKAYVWCEGWTTMGALLGVFAHVVETEDLSDIPNAIKRYKAIVETRTLDERVLSRAESECSDEEKKWRGRDDYAIRSMAQTRAISKALRMPLGWIMKLAGYESTPAEEIDENNIDKEVVLNGKGEVDVLQTEMANTVKKGVASYGLKEDNPKETHKMCCMREIDWLVKEKMKKDWTWFREKVKDVDRGVFGDQEHDELIQIKIALLNYLQHGLTIKKIPVTKKKEEGVEDDKK